MPFYGQFDFNKTPLVPPGAKAIIIYSKPEQRASWEFDEKIGFYVAPSMQHHRCVRHFMPQKRSKINVHTLVFISHAIPISSTTVEDFIH